MRTHGEPWSITLNSDGEITFALFVRDSSGLRSAESVPRLEPAVLPVAGPAAGSLEALWDEWWGGITGSRLVPPASTRVPADAPARLRGLQDGLRLPYARWAAERRAAEVRAPAREVFKMQDAVHRVQRELGTEGLAFELVIEEVPVEGVLWRRLSPGFVLASTSMLHSPLAVDALAAVVRELVAP